MEEEHWDLAASMEEAEEEEELTRVIQSDEEAEEKLVGVVRPDLEEVEKELARVEDPVCATVGAANAISMPLLGPDLEEELAGVEDPVRATVGAANAISVPLLGPELEEVEEELAEMCSGGGSRGWVRRRRRVRSSAASSLPHRAVRWMGHGLAQAWLHENGQPLRSFVAWLRAPFWLTGAWLTGWIGQPNRRKLASRSLVS